LRMMTGFTRRSGKKRNAFVCRCWQQKRTVPGWKDCWRS
jgi:hypothetical protein